MARRYWVVGRHTPDWTKTVTRCLAEGYLRHGIRGREVIKASPLRMDQTLNQSFLIHKEEGLLVLVPPRTNELIDTASRLTSAGRWKCADIAIVDCKPEDVRNIINIIGSFPKWPIAWWPNIERFQAHAKQLIDQLVSRQVQVVVGAGKN